MLMKKATYILFFLFFGLLIGTSFAKEATLFGPKTYAQTGGKPTAYTDTFSALSVPARARIIVKNGDEDGLNRIRRAIIRVNKELVFGPIDFNRHVYTLKAVINLKDKNSISIKVMGEPGTHLTVEIRQTVNPPSVALNAEPDAISYGESSILTWRSSNADTCKIEPGIGSVDANGSLSVSPTTTTRYMITATGPAGTKRASATVSVTVRISIDILSPKNGETLSRPYLMVQGTIANPAGNETGVAVNGVTAIVYGNQFVANYVPLEPGDNAIVASAADTEGNMATSSITINALTPTNYIRLYTDSASGVAPLAARLAVDGSFSFPESSISCEGPADVEFFKSTSENEYDVRILTPGIYFFTAEVIDDQNETCTDTVSIVVLDPVELDALLRTKWDGMKAALSDQRIGDALNYFNDDTKDLYSEIYTALYGNLPQVVGEMQDIELLYAKGNVAKYRIRRTEPYGARTFTITYYLYFAKIENGLWKIHRY